MTSAPLIDLQGAPRQRGLQYGESARERIALALDMYRREFETKRVSWAEALQIAATFRDDIAAYDADCTAEIDGIARGAGRSVEEIVILNARTEILYWKAGADAAAADLAGESEECTSLVAMPEVTADGHLWHAHNWDWQPECEATTVVLRVRAGDSTPDILTVCEAGQLARHGMNAGGVALTANGLHCNLDYGRRGLPNPIIRRVALRQSTLARAVFVIANATRAFSHNISVSDAAGEGLALETTPEALYPIAPSDGLLVHANHFQSPIAQLQIKDHNLKRTPDTLYRERRVRARLRRAQSGVDATTIREALSDRYGSPDAVCRSPAVRPGGMVSATVYTLIMDTTARSMSLALSPYRETRFASYGF